MLALRPMLHSGAAGSRLRFSAAGTSVRVLSQARPSFLSGSRPVARSPLVPKYPGTSGVRFTPSLLQSWHLSPQLGAASHFSSFFGGSGGRRPGGNRLAQGAGLIGAASLLLGKSKYLLAGLKLTKFASLGSMILSVGTYSMFFGLPYATGMVGLLLVHETGHALVMRSKGIPFSPMVFMPFVGAVVAMRKQPRDAWDEAIIAMGGPVLGSLGAGAVAIAASALDSQLCYALAEWGYMINLFNLLPIGALGTCLL